MGFILTSKNYMEYLKKVALIIEENKDYITQLDSVTGDGDHWTNMNMGFQKVVENKIEFETLTPSDLFMKIGMTLMSTIGGSSGVLYGSGYISAAKTLSNKDFIDEKALADVLMAMLKGICERGNSQPGMKTMIDTLYPAATAFKEAIDSGLEAKKALVKLEDEAKKGMESTKEMEAVRGRAYYQANKGVGHLDPGAVTMYYQLKTLVEYINSLL